MQLQDNKYTLKNVNYFLTEALQISHWNQLPCKYDEYNSGKYNKINPKKKEKTNLFIRAQKQLSHFIERTELTSRKKLKCENNKVKNHLWVLKNKKTLSLHQWSMHDLKSTTAPIYQWDVHPVGMKKQSCECVMWIMMFLLRECGGKKQIPENKTHPAEFWHVKKLFLLQK